ncbi:hypothetical protein [Rubritalea tangerina]
MVSNWMEGHTSNRILNFLSFVERMFCDRLFRFRSRRRGSLET